MLRYTPGASFAHRLDSRSKLLFQFGVAIAAFARPDWLWLAGLSGLAVLTLAAGRLSPVRVLYSYRVLFAVLAIGPLVAGVTLGDPWFRSGPALDSARSVSRLVPVLFVSAVYVHTTPVRETRAAIQRHVPGRIGQALGVGVGLVYRFFPLVVEDVRRIQRAIRVRGGDQRSVRDRSRRIALGSLRRAFERADNLSLALRARCFAWNPTLPPLQFSWFDYLVLAGGIGLALTPLLV